MSPFGFALVSLGGIAVVLVLLIAATLYHHHRNRPVWLPEGWRWTPVRRDTWICHFCHAQARFMIKKRFIRIHGEDIVTIGWCGRSWCEQGTQRMVEQEESR